LAPNWTSAAEQVAEPVSSFVYRSFHEPVEWLHPPRTSSGKQLSDMRRSNLARGAYELDRFVTCPQAALLPDINRRPNLCPPGAGPTRLRQEGWLQNRRGLE